MNPLRPRIHDFLSRLLVLLCMLTATACAPLAQAGPGYASANYRYSQAELDQMLAPIALYPDALLSQILMAATYPLEVVEAAHWTQTNPGYVGTQAVQIVEADHQIDWDPSVKSLVAFPQLLQRMEQNLTWTQRLGAAFLNQQAEVMDTIQHLRRRAMEQGNLQSSEQIYVYPQGSIITIEPVNPQIVYVPYYDPNVIYGTWWWGGYPPVYWAPWPGYYRPAPSVAIRPGYPAPLSWGLGVAVGTGFFFGMFDWRQHHVHIHPDYRDRYDHGWHDRRPPPPQVVPAPIWRHEPEHRRDRPAPMPQPQIQPQPHAPSGRPSAPPTMPAMPMTPPADSYRDRQGPRNSVPPATAPKRDWHDGDRRDERAVPRERAPMVPKLGPAVRPAPESAPTPQPAAPASTLQAPRFPARPAPVVTLPAPPPAAPAPALSTAPTRQAAPVSVVPSTAAPAQMPQRTTEIGGVRSFVDRVERTERSAPSTPRETPSRSESRERMPERGNWGDRSDRSNWGGRERPDGGGDGRQR